MVPYEEVLNYLKPGALITFKTYKLDRHENRKLVMAFNNVGVYKVIPANYTLTRLEMEDIYSDDLTDEEYLQLSKQNCFRFVIVTAMENNYLKYTVIQFNKDYYLTGLQEIVFPNLNLDTKYVKRIPIRL